MEKKDEIVFRPLTEGLGFHPFSDGLPYAPVSKSSRPQAGSGGTGATAAGPPKAVLQTHSIPAPAPRISVPVANPKPAQMEPHPVKSPELPIVRYGFGYSLKRLTAYFIDMVLNSVFFFAILIVMLLRQESHLSLFSSSKGMMVVGLFWAAFHWLFTALQEVLFGASIGKWVLRLKMQGSSFLILLRAILFITSLGFAGLGIVWALFDRKKRCFHDWIVGIQPNEVR